MLVTDRLLLILLLLITTALVRAESNTPQFVTSAMADAAAADDHAVADIVRVSGDVTGLNGRLAWWPGAPNDAGLAVVRSASARFVPAPPGPAFGVPRVPLWFRVALENASPSARDFMLEAAFPKIDILDVHIVHGDGQVDSWLTGEVRPFAGRPVPSPRFLFPVKLGAGERVTLFLRVESAAVVNLPLTLYDERAYLAHASRVYGWLGAFYGLVFSLLAYSAFLFRATRDHAFLYYAVVGALAVGYFASVDGYVAVVFSGSPWIVQHLLYLCAALSVTFMLLFARGFLNLAALAPRLDRALLVIAALATLATLLVPFLPLVYSLGAIIALSLVMAVMMAIAGVASLRAGFRPARWFVIAISVHLLMLTLVSVGAVSSLPGLFELADIGHRLDIVFSLVCFTLALGERIRHTEEERRHAEERVIEVAADIRARNEFLSRMSHELRTPMTGVLGMAELLEQTPLIPQQRRYLSTLRYSGEMLLNLINDVLDHARIEAGRLQLRREAFDLLKLIDDCRMLFEQQPRDNDVTLHIDVGTGVSRIAVGDAQRIRQVLVNLMAHAFKRTVRGSVALRLSALATPGWVRFEVQAAGAAAGGSADAAQIFANVALQSSVAVEAQKKWQGNPLAVSHGDTGLGLGICRQLCELMGGRMGAQRTADGDLFWFELPLYAAA